MKIKAQISFSWWNTMDTAIEPSYEVREILIENAQNKIFEMRQKGFIEGELVDEVDGSNYRGWWTFKQELEEVEPQVVESYKTMALSTCHMTEGDMSCLERKSGLDNMILQRDTGIFIKLPFQYGDEDKEFKASLDAGYSEALKAVLTYAFHNGYQMIEFDSDALVVSGFEHFDW